MKKKRTFLPQLPARLEQEIIDAANEVRLSRGQTWAGYMGELIKKSIDNFKKRKP